MNVVVSQYEGVHRHHQMIQRWIVSSCARVCWGYVDLVMIKSVFSSLAVIVNSIRLDKRIEYKLLLYTYKALHDLAPRYLCESVVLYVPRRVLKSVELNLLTVPPGKPGKYGSRSFARASANLWNSLRGGRAAWLKNSPTLESFKI